MLFHRCARVAGALLALAATLPCLPAALGQTGRHAPPRVNTQSIRTSGGQPLLRAFRVAESADRYQGGFLHVYPGRHALRPQQAGEYVAQAQFAEEPGPENELLPPLPSDEGEEVMGIMEPSTDQPVFAESPVIVDGAPGEGFVAAECGPCKGGKGHGKGHGKGGAFSDWNWACFCVPLPPLDNLSVNAGVHGFKNQLSLGFDDSFGFHEGANLGAAFGLGHLGLGWQVGLQGVHSNFSGAGDNIIGGVDEDRNQLFFTWGFFRRVDSGLQGGFVIDHLRDEWYYDEIHLSQLRGELSLMHNCYHEFGIFFHTNLEDEDVLLPAIPQMYEQATQVNIETTDLVALFYRHHFDDCGYSYFRTYIGLTGNRDFFDSETEESSAVLGGDIHIGLSEHWALETGFTFVTPADEEDNAQQEDWNVGFNVVWYPYGQRANTLRRYYRPLFNVADNGSMLINIRD